MSSTKIKKLREKDQAFGPNKQQWKEELVH